MSLNTTSWRPDLPAVTLQTERATLVGDSVSFMVYGVTFSIYVQTMYTLLNSHRHARTPHRWSLVALATILFSLITIFTGLDLDWLKRAFIDNRDAPGGPEGYLVLLYSDVKNTVTNAASIVGEWIGEGYLLYRCFVIFRVRHVLMIFPVLMYLAMIAMGCLLLFQSSRPESSLWGHSAIAVGLPYFTLSTALNVLITTMISIRIFMHRRDILRAAGPEFAHSVPYASIAAMLIESSALYSVVAVVFIAGYASQSYVSNIFLGILAQVQILAPLLIIFRVSQRRAWDETTARSAESTTVRFRRDMTTGQRTTTGFEGNEDSGHNTVPVFLGTGREGKSTVNASPSPSSGDLEIKAENEKSV